MGLQERASHRRRALGSIRSMAQNPAPGSVQLPAAYSCVLVLCLLSPLAAFRGVGRAGV